MKNKDTGNFGENLACNYLIKKGFTILEQNWRYKHLEIDIIACKENRLHIVEVNNSSSKSLAIVLDIRLANICLFRLKRQKFS